MKNTPPQGMATSRTDRIFSFLGLQGSTVGMRFWHYWKRGIGSLGPRLAVSYEKHENLNRLQETQL